MHGACKMTCHSDLACTITLCKQVTCLLRRAHSAGVCCIVCSPWQPEQLCTGSYDEHVRLWDMREPSRPLECTKVLLQLLRTSAGLAVIDQARSRECRHVFCNVGASAQGAC